MEEMLAIVDFVRAHTEDRPFFCNAGCIYIIRARYQFFFDAAGS
jgi:hypothetical protein